MSNPANIIKIVKTIIKKNNTILKSLENKNYHKDISCLI